jgi:hypothetical protein
MSECACSQSVGRLAQRAVGCFADEAVDSQTTTLLKGTHRMVEFDVEAIESDVSAGRHVVVGTSQQPESGECGADLDNCAATISVT